MAYQVWCHLFLNGPFTDAGLRLAYVHSRVCRDLSSPCMSSCQWLLEGYEDYRTPHVSFPRPSPPRLKTTVMNGVTPRWAKSISIRREARSAVLVCVSPTLTMQTLRMVFRLLNTSLRRDIIPSTIPSLLLVVVPCDPSGLWTPSPLRCPRAIDLMVLLYSCDTLSCSW